MRAGRVGPGRTRGRSCDTVPRMSGEPSSVDEHPTERSDGPVLARHRAHQGRLRSDVLGLPMGLGGEPKHPVDSMLPTDHGGITARDAGWNLMSPAARDYAQHREKAARRGGGTVGTTRLWQNMLSSQPLAFSIAGELRAHREPALRVLAAQTGRELDAFTTSGRDPWQLDRIDAEWAPETDELMKDRSAADLAAIVLTADERRLLITVEVKYTEPFSRDPLDGDHYDQALEICGVDGATARRLHTEDKATQFLRSVLLTGVEKHRERCDDVLAVVLGRDDDQRARDVVTAVGDAVPSVPTAYWSFPRLFDACAAQPELATWAGRMSYRYCPEP